MDPSLTILSFVDSPAILFVLIAAVVFFVWLHEYSKKCARRNAVAGWAAAKGLYFEPDKVRGFDDQHPLLECLRQGRDRYAYNIASGRWGDYDITVFDYHYETGSGDDTTSHHFTAMLLEPGHLLRPLLVREEGFFDKLKAGFGAGDINFESAEFSKRFYVTSPDKKWAYDVLHTRTIEFLMKAERARLGFTFQCDNHALCVVSKRVLEVSEFEYARHYGKTILDGIPEYAKQSLESEPLAHGT